MNKKKVVDSVLRRLDKLVSVRSPQEERWRDIAKYIAPRRQEMFSKGQKTSSDIYNSSPVRDSNRLASSINTLLTNESMRWIVYGTRNMELRSNRAYMKWLDECSSIVLTGLSDSNFYLKQDEMYIDYVPFGTASKYIEEVDMYPFINFDVYPIWEVYVAENRYGMVDTLYRKFPLSVRQVVQMFSLENVSPDIKRKYDKQNYDDEVTIVHAVQPRLDFPSSPLEDSKPWASYYIVADNRWLLSSSGYYEFPFTVPRWRKAAREDYGRGPGDEAIADARTLNTMGKTNLKIARKIAEPPMIVEQFSLLNPLKTGANAVNYLQAGTQFVPKTLYDNWNRDLPFALENEMRREKSVSASFYGDELVLPNNDRMTAEEIMTRRNMSYQSMGPIVSRLITEDLSPTAERVFKIYLRKGMFPECPVDINEAQMKVFFESPLVRMQREHDVQALQKAITILAPLAQSGMPQIMDNFNPDEITYHVVDRTGCPKRFLNSEKDVKAIREQRAQAEAEAAAAENAAKAAKAGKDASSIDPAKIQEMVGGI